jgi:RNA polymerase sigma factor (sigma-70 family)
MENTGDEREHLPVGSNQQAAWFATTHWSVVFAAKEEDSKLAADAIESLCQTYWTPLYGYIRREGYSPEDAQDLTQEFLFRFVEKKWIGRLQDQRAKFRSFLLGFLKNFLSDERDRKQAQKRGGGKTVISLDAFEAEERDRIAATQILTPEQAYDRRWAEAVVTQAAERLRQSYVSDGKTSLYERLKDLQPGEHGECSYALIGKELGMTEQAVKNAVLRFRRRYARVLREEIAQTVTDPQEIEGELNYLLNLFSR